MTKKEQIIQMRQQGLKCKDIADALGCSRQYISMVCGGRSPSRFQYIGDKCIYPNLRKWMNENKVSRTELLRRMGLVTKTANYTRITNYIYGQYDPSKRFIDRMLKITGLTYETLFYTEVEDDGELY